MIPALLATVVAGFASAFIPAIPAEPYVIGLMATTDLPAVPVGVAVAIGQTGGKVLIFLTVRGLIRAPWLQRWIGKRLPFLARKDARVPAPRKRRTADAPVPAPRGAAEPVPSPAAGGSATGAVVADGAAPDAAGAGVAESPARAGVAGSAAGVGVAESPAGAGVAGSAAGAGVAGSAAGAAQPEGTAGSCEEAPGATADEPPPSRGRAIRRVLAVGMAKLVALLDRPLLQAPIVLLSAAVGLPPLLLVSAYAARTQMTTGLFAAVCLVGRSIRFVAIAYTPGLVMD